MAKHPAKAQITADIAGDLRKAYLLSFDEFSTDPQEVADLVNGNVRYARELLGVLTTNNLLTATDVNGDGDVWQVIDPGTYDDHTRDEAEAVIDAFIAKHLLTTAKKATAPKSKPDSVTADGSPCLCGCGEATGKKSNYRPGHDARHAGNVGRAIAAEYATPGFDRRELLAVLPSDSLKAKAEAIAEKAVEKANKKSAKAGPVVEEGIITVGKNEVAALRTDGVVSRVDGKAVSKTAAKTFQPG